MYHVFHGVEIENKYTNEQKWNILDRNTENILPDALENNEAGWSGHRHWILVLNFDWPESYLESLYFYFYQFYWDIIDIWHCTN